MAFPDYFMQELKSRCDIEDVVSSYVNLKRKGKSLLGLCPFHNEKTPSFNVVPSKGFFHCFGCGAGGDVITFIERIENLDYVDAVKFLAQRAGLEVPQDTPRDDSMNQLRLRIKEINRETARFYHSYLMSPEGRKGLDYFLSRGLSIKTIKHFGLGFSPETRYALVDHLRQLKYNDNEMVQANVAFKSKAGHTVDRFIGRAMFPIIDTTGNVVAFGGRALGDEKPKYINTSDTPVYKKSNGLFAMNFAKNSNSDQLILAEGYMDVISLHAAGFTNAIASLGTALTQEQAKIIAKYCKEAIICYDSDEPGQKAAQRAIPILKSTGINVRVLTVPGNKDPDEFFKSNGENGPALFRKLINDSGNDTEYRLQKIRLKYDLTTADGSVKYLTEACSVLADIRNEIERNVYAGKLATEVNVDKSAILNQVGKEIRSRRAQYRKQLRQHQSKELSGLNDSVNTEKRNNVQTANAEENIIRYLFDNPEKKDIVEQQIKESDFATAFNRRLYELLIEKISQNSSVDMIDFAESLNQKEMEAFTKIICMDVAKVSDADVQKSIEIVKTKSTNLNKENVENMDASQIQEYLNKLRESKK